MYLCIMFPKLLVGKPEKKRPCDRPKIEWEDNIFLDLKEMGYEGDWKALGQDRVIWRAYVHRNFKKSLSPSLII